MQLRPGENFVVVRQLEDPFDSGTYYVQAKIRDARTDELLATLNLEDQSNQRFTAPWVVCADASGLGRWIDIETMVYTDSGYSSISDIYQRENRTYLVEERASISLGGGAEVDYKKIKTILNEILTIGEKGATKNAQKSADEKAKSTAEIKEAVAKSATQILSVIEEGFNGVADAIENIEKPEKLDGVMSAIGDMKDDMRTATQVIVTAVEKNKVEATDIKLIMEKLEGMTLETYQKKAEELIDSARSVVGDDMVKITKMWSSIRDYLESIPFIVLNGSKKEFEDVEGTKLEEKTKVRKRNLRGFSAVSALIGVAFFGAAILYVASGPYQVVKEYFEDKPIVEEPVDLSVGDTVSRLDPWTVSTTPSTAITQRSVNRAVRITGLASCNTIDTDVNGFLSCGTDAEGSVATSTVRGMFSGASGITYNSGTGAFTLTSDTVSFGGVSVALGGSDATPAFNLADATGLPVSTGIAGLGSDVATFLGTPSSANFFSAITNETGSGSVVGSISPAFTGLSTFVALSVSSSSTLGYASSTALTVSGNSFFNFASSSYASTTGLTAQNAVLANFTNTNGTSSVLTVSSGLKIPNGTGCVADDPGEICHDTSDNQLVMDDWIIPSKTELFMRTIASTSVYFATSSSWYFPTLEDGYVVTDLNCKVKNGTSKPITMFGETMTCDTNGEVDDGSIAIATVGAGSTTVMYTLGAGAGAVDEIIFTVYGYKVRE